MSQTNVIAAQRELAEKVRDACVKAAVSGFEQARMDGLCVEGAVETAVSAIQNLNLDKLLTSWNTTKLP